MPIELMKMSFLTPVSSIARTMFFAIASRSPARFAYTMSCPAMASFSSEVYAIPFEVNPADSSLSPSSALAHICFNG
jgi:hypothetical protein